MKITFDKNDSQLIWLAKGHFDKCMTTWNNLEKLYSKVYQYEPNLIGIFHFVFKVWYKIVLVKIPAFSQATGGDMESFDEGEWVRKEDVLIHFRDEIGNFLNGILPSENWKYGGRDEGLFLSSDKLVYSKNDLLKAQILVMLSQIRMTEVKYLDLKEKWENFPKE